MSRCIVFGILLALWAGLVALSIVLPAITPPSDFGFTAGLNRITLFLQYQAIAFVVGAVLWFVSSRLESPMLRWLGRAPVLLALAFVAVFVGVVLYLNLTGPDPQPSARLPTKPAPPAAAPVD